MKRLMSGLPALFVPAALLLAGCTTTPQANVVRFHQNAPVGSASIAVIPREAAMAESLEFRAHAQSVEDELRRLGFSPVVAGNASDFVATVDVFRTTHDRGVSRPRSSVSIGGGVGGGSVGGGLGVTLPVGGNTDPKTVSAVTLSVAIRQRAEGRVVWEGRAQTEVAGPGDPVPALARTLFRDYPGPNGQSVTTPLN